MGEITGNHISEIIRFCVVGTLAVAIQYAVYLLALLWLNHNFSFIIGYVASFLFNCIYTLRFTFKVKASKRRLIGFAFSHIINFYIQCGLLNLFVYWIMDRRWAMAPVFVICVPVNFLLVRYFMKNKLCGV